MSRIPAQDLAAELKKHFKGTPEDRVALALKLGWRSLEFFLAAQPAGTSEQRAAEILRRNKHRGRRRSRVMEGPR